MVDEKMHLNAVTWAATILAKVCTLFVLLWLSQMIVCAFLFILKICGMIPRTVFDMKHNPLWYVISPGSGVFLVAMLPTYRIFRLAVLSNAAPWFTLLATVSGIALISGLILGFLGNHPLYVLFAKGYEPSPSYSLMDQFSLATWLLWIAVYSVAEAIWLFQSVKNGFKTPLPMMGTLVDTATKLSISRTRNIAIAAIFSAIMICASLIFGAL